MPELPEVETTKRGIAAALIGQSITSVWYSGKNLRYPVSQELLSLSGIKITDVTRRAKYLVISLENQCHLLFHLGMSGMMRLQTAPYQAIKHDHLLVQIASGICLVFHDPRRFGCVLWVEGDVNQHPMVKKLGPEPLGPTFNASYLKQQAAQKKVSVKSFIMNNDVVVGVGNIYASEALFQAGIHPHRQAHRISKTRYQALVNSIQKVLREAIKAGGTTLKDFHDSQGKPGYFQQELLVYGRENKPCVRCQINVKKVKTGQRSTYFCPQCQR